MKNNQKSCPRTLLLNKHLRLLCCEYVAEVTEPSQRSRALPLVHAAGLKGAMPEQSKSGSQDVDLADLFSGAGNVAKVFSPGPSL